jgi:hypothetical protein
MRGGVVIFLYIFDQASASAAPIHFSAIYLFEVGIDDPLFAFFKLVRAFFVTTKNYFELLCKGAFVKIFYFKDRYTGFVIASGYR